MVTPEQYSLNIDRILKLERENMQLRAMISTRDSEIMDLNKQIDELQSYVNNAVDPL